MQKLNKMFGLIMTVFLLAGCSGDNDLQVSMQETSWEDQVLVVREGSADMPGSEASGETEATGGAGTVVESETAAESETAVAPTENHQEFIYVQVTGAVHMPGVYKMPADSRVFEAVNQAGGMLEEAEPSAVNQALALTDGQMIYIYTKQEWEETQQRADVSTSTGAADVSAGSEDFEAADDGRVNINTAGKEQLCGIPGIGEIRAESILTYRQEHGRFETIEDIKKVSGIKDGLFEKIKDKIKV